MTSFNVGANQWVIGWERERGERDSDDNGRMSVTFAPIFAG